MLVRKVQNTRQTIKKKGNIKNGLLASESDEYDIVDIPLPVLADIVEAEKNIIARLNL